MFPFNQWSFNPQAYQNVPSDRVDWASLAQQWIKMKETVPNIIQEPTPPPAPLISKPKNSRPESTELPPNDIEGGEAPMDMDTKDDEIPESDGAGSNLNQWNWPNQWGWGWSGNAGTVPSADNASSMSSSVDSKVKWNENLILPTNSSKSTSETWSKGNRPRQSQKPVVIEQSPIIDAAKKKQLPAWIREGLNKMEREKQKKIESERLMQERLMRKQEFFGENSPEENLPITVNKPTYVLDDPSRNAATIASTAHPFEPTAFVPDLPFLSSPPRGKEENTSLIRKTKDEIMEESMLKIRKILTEILLEATENHVVTIAREELKRAKSSARAILRRSNALSSLTGNLGLNVYGSGSDDSDSSGSGDTYLDKKSDSDEDLKVVIDRKKQEFRRIEDEIEVEIEKQEAKEKSIARPDEEDDDDDEDSDVNDTINNTDATSRLQEVPRQEVRSKSCSRQNSKEENDSTSSSKSKDNRLPNPEPSSGDGNRSSSHINGDRKNSEVEKHSRSSSSSSSSKSESSSSSSKSSHSSESGDDSEASSHKKHSKHSEKTNKRSKKSKRYRSQSRSRSRDRRTDSRMSSSRSHKSESYGRRSSPYRRRSRSRQRSSSRGRERYSESSRRYDSHSKRRRSNSSDSRRSRYKRR